MTPKSDSAAVVTADNSTKRDGVDRMSRMSKKRKEELAFFLNERGRVTYNDLCRKCRNDCKQSFRAGLIECPRYLSKRAKQPQTLSGQKNGRDHFDHDQK